MKAVISQVTVKGRKFRPEPSKIIGQGGEAIVYDISDLFPEAALKLLRLPGDPFYAGGDEQSRRNRDGAEKRLALYQKKLPAFPCSLPARVIAPQAMAVEPSGRIVGYSMRLLSGAKALRDFSDFDFRERSGVTNGRVTRIFLDAHATFAGLHQAGVVAGDVNNLNALVLGDECWLIDADSMQFGAFLTLSFTPRYVDPRLCNPKLTKLVQTAPHTRESDWYAFALMLFECLTLVHPYGGVYRPGKGAKPLPLDARPLKRVSVLHPQVIYPRGGLPLRALPPELLKYYEELLGQDRRGPFPRELLAELRWQRCPLCGLEHALSHCPDCVTVVAVPALRQEIHGRVRRTRVFSTAGVILEAVFQGGQLRLLYHEDGAFRREFGVVMQGELIGDMRSRISGERTLIGVPGRVAVLSRGGAEQLPADNYRGRFPVFDANERHHYRLAAGRLVRDDLVGERRIGDVLSGQTLFWAGPRFGLGLYQAGSLQVAFSFDGELSGVNDSLKLPKLDGDLLDAACHFGGEFAWLLLTERRGGRNFQHCHLIRRNGAVLASASAEEGDGSWLDSIHSKCAASLGGARPVLFAATDNGLVRIEEQGGKLAEAAVFPETAGVIRPGQRLLTGPTGIYAVSRGHVDLFELNL